MLANKLRAATAAAAGGGEPVGIDFDGTNDYLSRSSDLVGNADGKTFTLSFWIFIDGSASIPNNVEIIRVNFFQLKYLNSEYLQLSALNSSLFPVWNMNITDVGVIPRNTWLNFIVSGDAASGVGSCYINDILHSSFPTTVNDNIDFTGTSIWVGRYAGCRLAGVYLDYTYRDLSVEANRRDFIDADGRYVKPPTSGIISVPMDDPDDPGRNDGTGGDFTLNGVVAQAGRGPNQYNAPASTFDGSADYLSASNITGITDTKTFTSSFWINGDSFRAGGDDHIWSFLVGGLIRNRIYTKTDGNLYILLRNSSSSNILIATLTSTPLVENKWYHVVVSVDLSDTAKRHVYVDGVAQTPTWSTYTDDTIDWTNDQYEIARSNGVEYWDGGMSDFWFDTTYIDLSTNNPFYDSETGKPKDLGVDGSNPTGSAPLIYLPLRADDAGSNKGTGGDFTVNSGPYTGARGPSEFWGESAEFNGTNQYLERSSVLTGAVASKTFSLIFAAKPDVDIAVYASLFFGTSGGGTRFECPIKSGSGQNSTLKARNSSNIVILEADIPSAYTAGNYSIVMISLDLTNSLNRHVYVNGSSTTPTWFTYSNDTIPFNESVQRIGRGESTQYLDGKIGFLWFNTEYIDFSQEANRLKFFDAFGYPVDLGEDGSLPTGNQPLIYMNNDFQLGTNLGSGGNFTPQNTPTDGGYVKG